MLTHRPQPVSRPPPRADSSSERIASAAIFASVAGFVGLTVPAMLAYPGGTVWDRTTRGSDFWLNYLSDLQRSVALNGEPNARGSALAQAAMLVLALGLAHAWWLATRLFPRHRCLGRAVHVSGLGGLAGAVAVGLMPSDLFGGVHSLAIVLGGVPGLVAAGLAVVGVASRGRATRLAAVVGAAMVLVSSADFLLYVASLGRAGPDLMAIPVLERASVLLVLCWMCAIAWHGARVRADDS
jgi:hypothetical protein